LNEKIQEQGKKRERHQLFADGLDGGQHWKLLPDGQEPRVTELLKEIARLEKEIGRLGVVPKGQAAKTAFEEDWSATHERVMKKAKAIGRSA
jgi:hypothetical protein